MRGRQTLYPNIGPDSNRERSRASSARHACPGWIGEHGGAIFIAYPVDSRDHRYVHRLGQSQGCELCGLAERAGPGSSTVSDGMGALGAPISGVWPVLDGWPAGPVEPCAGCAAAAGQAPA